MAGPSQGYEDLSKYEDEHEVVEMKNTNTRKPTVHQDTSGNTPTSTLTETKFKAMVVHGISCSCEAPLAEQSNGGRGGEEWEFGGSYQQREGEGNGSV